MFNSNNHPKDAFTEWYRSMNGSLFVFGLSLITFAILIFLYPALIGILFAAFILVVGGVVLWGAYRMYRFKKNIETEFQGPSPIRGTVRTEGPHYVHRQITWIIR